MEDRQVEDSADSSDEDDETESEDGEDVSFIRSGRSTDNKRRMESDWLF